METMPGNSRYLCSFGGVTLAMKSWLSFMLQTEFAQLAEERFPPVRMLPWVAPLGGVQAPFLQSGCKSAFGELGPRNWVPQ